MNDALVDADAERNLLSCLMRAGQAHRSEAVSQLEPWMFHEYDDVASVVLDISGSETRPDPDTVRAKVDSPSRVDRILDSRPAPSNATQFVEPVREAAGARRLWTQTSKGLRRLEEGDRYDEVAHELETASMDVTADLSEANLEQVGYGIADVYDQLQVEDGKRVTGLRSGFPELDQITMGWQDGDLIIPAGSTSMGKTAFGLCAALNAAQNGRTAVVFSTEMAPDRIRRRLLGYLAKVDLRKTKLTNDDWQRVAKAAGQMEDLPIYVDGSSRMDPVQIHSAVRDLDRREGVSLVVVDYLQRLSPPPGSYGSKRDEVHETAEALKSAAKDTQIPWIVPSQTGRSNDRRESKRPSIVDLRQAGEEPADVILGLYRAEYYGITHDDAGRSTEGVGEVTVLKNRSTGGTGTVDLAFVKDYGAWAPLEERREPDPDMYTGDGMPAADESPF